MILDSTWAHSNGLNPWTWRTFPSCPRDVTTEDAGKFQSWKDLTTVAGFEDGGRGR